MDLNAPLPGQPKTKVSDADLEADAASFMDLMGMVNGAG